MDEETQYLIVFISLCCLSALYFGSGLMAVLKQDTKEMILQFINVGLYMGLAAFFYIKIQQIWNKKGG